MRSASGLLLLLALLAVSFAAEQTSTSAGTTSTTPGTPSNATEEAVELGDRGSYHQHRRPPPHRGSSAESSSWSGGSSAKLSSSYGGGHNEHHHGGGGGGGHGDKFKKSPLRMDYAWKHVDYVFPSDRARSDAIRSGNYNYTKIIALDVDVWEKAGRKKVFITMPTDKGVPASLATVSSEGDPHAPLLKPYPDWSWHRRGDCRSISSVFRVAIDDYDRLWVMDRGDDAQCPPKIMTFDLNTDRLLSKFEIPANLLVNKSNLITPVVDVRDHGRNTFLYIADVIGGIIVYDHQSKSAWRVNHRLTLPEPAYSTHTIAGTTFYLADGAFGMALSPLRCEGGHQQGGHQQGGHQQGGGSYQGGHQQGGHQQGGGSYQGGHQQGGHQQGGGSYQGGQHHPERGHRCEEDRTLYFHALASVSENHVKTSVLRNRENFRNGVNRADSQFKSFEQKRRSQSAAQAMSPEGVLFSGLLPDLALTCWDTEQPFAGWNIEPVARDAEALQFTSGVKVRYGRVWVVTCRYQRFATGTMNWNEVNYRVQSARVEDLIRGTKCDSKTNNIG